jgi:hypothetical protein
VTWRRWLLLLVGVLLVLVYLYAAVTTLPQWIVSISAGKADANTELNAVTSTRAALLGIVTPLVIVFGGIAGVLNYQEVRSQNRRANALALVENDERRRVRRAEVYAEFLSACHACVEAAYTVYLADRADADYLSHLIAIREKRAAMELSCDRVRMLGADTLQEPARDLNRHCGVEIATKASARRKLSDEEWKRIVVTEYAPLYVAFIDATRRDLAPTR